MSTDAAFPSIPTPVGAPATIKERPLPAGWVADPASEHYPDTTVLKLLASDGSALGFVTIDNKGRGFTPGISYGYRAPLDGRNHYAGSGWQARLYRDAIAHVEAVFADELPAPGAKP